MRRHPVLWITGFIQFVRLAVLAMTIAALSVVQGLVPLLVVIAVNSVFVQVYFGPLFSWRRSVWVRTPVGSRLRR